jgi:hypothetical protein
VVERVRVGVLATVVVVALELGVGGEGFVGDVVFVGDDFVGVEADGVDGSGNSLGWLRVATMMEKEKDLVSVGEWKLFLSRIWLFRKGTSSCKGDVG